MVPCTQWEPPRGVYVLDPSGGLAVQRGLGDRKARVLLSDAQSGSYRIQDFRP